ncbi:MAG: Hsp70 family protein [Chloroflexota bacterium]
MDFGTTNSGIAVYDGQRLQLIPIDPSNQNAAVARTALYITNDRQVYIGRGAIDTYYAQNLNRPVSIEKVRVGEITLTFAEIGTFVRDVYIDKDVLAPGRLFLSFKMALSSLNYLGTVVGSHFYFLEDIIALYLYIAKQRAETFLGHEVNKIVLGRPVRYSLNPQDDKLARERLLKAAFRAGYDEVYLQYEPIAAAYHYESTINKAQNVLIFDFGGGTLDISVVRVGDPRRREVLANGGLPIAGDVFDQKLVRERLPKHFGEGSFYRSQGKRLPVPSSFFEAFSNWQDMLLLQKPETLEAIERIERTAERPRQIRALRNLISSSYGLKMYDTVEAVKRRLSSEASTSIRLDAQDFDVYEPITRADFERILRPDIETVDAYLDTVLDQAGLTANDIDRVIRTGGSSEIPAFIELLGRRFGADKVGSIDIFSSVTSGLGIIAHRIEKGEMEAEVHHKADYVLNDHIESTTQNGIPAVDFDMMKKFVALVETAHSDQQAVTLIGFSDGHQIGAATQLVETFANDMSPDILGIPSENLTAVLSAKPDDPVLLCTSEYRFIRKTVRELARMTEIGLDLAEVEGLQQDAFGDEYVSAIFSWTPQPGAEFGFLITTSGYFRNSKAEPLMARLEQSVPYQPARLKGDPVVLMTALEGDELVLFTSTGRALHINTRAIGQLEGRLMSVPPQERIIGGWAIQEPQYFLLAADDGDLTVLSSTDIPLVGALNTNGEKVFAKRSLQTVCLWDGRQPIWVVTSQRILPLDMQVLQDDFDKPQRALKLQKDERLISLMTLPKQSD